MMAFDLHEEHLTSACRAGYYVHPTLSDCGLHLSAITPTPDPAGQPAPARVPVGLAGCHMSAQATGACFGGWAASGVAPLPDSTDVRCASQCCPSRVEAALRAANLVCSRPRAT